MHFLSSHAWIHLGFQEQKHLGPLVLHAIFLLSLFYTNTLLDQEDPDSPDQPVSISLVNTQLGVNVKGSCLLLEATSFQIFLSYGHLPVCIEDYLVNHSGGHIFCKLTS